MKKSYLLALALSLSSLTHAQDMLVSDVDDTIKVSHVLDIDSTLANVPMLKNAFIGMPALYRLIAKDTETTTVKYLSNSPQRIFGDLHRKFIKKNDFPAGNLVGRRWTRILKWKDHKLKMLRYFVENYSPKDMILIGDNGEHDPEIYAQFKKEFPEISGPTYIHQVYSSEGYAGNFGKPLEEGQIGFTTSVDIAVDLLNRNYLAIEEVEKFVLETVPSIIEEGNFEERGHHIAFPAWMDCRDYQAKEIPVLVDVEANELLQKYSSKLDERCSRQPYKN